MAIEQSVNKAFKHVEFKSRCSGNGNGSGGGSYSNSNVTFHKCVKKSHIQKDCTSKVTGSSGNPPKYHINEIQE